MKGRKRTRLQQREQQSQSRRRGRPRRKEQNVCESETNFHSDVDIVYQKAPQNAETLQCTKSDNNKPSFKELVKSCKDVRIVLEDIKYGNILSHKQRQDLAPKRRRRSSNLSDRTKQCLNKVIKEESKWFSSSMESLIDFFNPRTLKLKKRKHNKKNKKLGNDCMKNIFYNPITIKTENDAPEKHSQVSKESQNKTSKQLCKSRTHSKIKKEVEYKSCSKRSMECTKDKFTDPKMEKIVRNFSKTNYLIERLLDDKDTDKNAKLPVTDKKRKQDDKHDRSKRLKVVPLSPEKPFLENSLISNSFEPTKYEFPVKNDKTITTTISSERKPSSHNVQNPTQTESSGIDLRDSELSSYINYTKPEDFGSLHPFLQPLDKDISLDVLERAIEHDWASGNRLLPINDIKIGNTHTEVLPGIFNADEYTSNLSENQEIVQGQWAIYDSNESSNTIANLHDSSILSSGSATSFGSGKRKLPEIIKDDLLPKGTINVPSVKAKYCEKKQQRSEDKSRSVSKHGEQKKLQSNSHDTAEVFSDEKLSGALKNWSTLPEIAAFLEQKTHPIDKDSIASNWSDTLNNNQLENVIGKDDSRAYSITQHSSPRGSNISDEFKAMSQLLSTLDESQEDENVTANSLPKKRQVVASVPLLPNIDDDKKRINSDQLTKIDYQKQHPVVRLTTQNLNRFNHLCPNDCPTKSNFSMESSNLLTNLSRQEKERPAPVGFGQRKLTFDEQDKKAEPRGPSNKIKLVRMQSENGEKWTTEPCDSSTSSAISLGSSKSLRIDERFSEEEEEEEGGNQLILPTEKNNVSNNNKDVVKEMTGKKNVDSNVCFKKRSPPCENVQNGKIGDDREIPSFGEPSIYKVDERVSSRSSSSSSPSQSSSSSSSSSDDSDSEQCESTVEVSNRTGEIAELRKQTKSGDTLEDVPRMEEMPTETIATIESPSPERMFNENLTHSRLSDKLQDLVSELGINDDDTYIDYNEIVSKPEKDQIKSSAEDCTESALTSTRTTLEACESEKTCEAEKASGVEKTAGSLHENDEKLSDEVDDELDCISLFAESLSESRCGSPGIVESSKRATPLKKDSYASMKSTNLGIYMAENNRECEEDLLACKDNTAEDLFNEPIFDATTINDESQVCVRNDKLPDLRETLNYRASNRRDVPGLFKGQCFGWLKNGSCLNINTCRYRHGLKPILQEFQFDGQSIDEVVAYALKYRYTHFIEIIHDKITANMSTPEVILFYKRTYSNRLIAMKIIENTINALKARGLSSQEILYSLLQDVPETDTTFLRMTLTAMSKNVERGNLWDILGSLLAKMSPMPLDIVENVIQETLEKNCRIQANNVYDNLLKKIPYYMRTRIRAGLWTQFQRLKDGVLEALHIEMDPPELQESHTIASPESPQLEKTAHEEPAYLVARKNLHFSPRPSEMSSLFPSQPGENASVASSNSAWRLIPIDDLPSPKGPYRDSLWKFHWDLQGIQQGLKYKDYNHVLNILLQYTEQPDRLPHINGFYKILCNEISSAKHHVSELIRLTVQCGSGHPLRLYLYELGVHVLAKLTDIGAWLHAYELLKILNVFGSYNTCAFTLLAAEIYIANQRPSKALDLLEKSGLIYANSRKWREYVLPNDMSLRITVIDSLLCSLCDICVIDAFRLLEFVFNDQRNTFKPINLVPYFNRIARLLILERHTDLIVELGRLVFQGKISIDHRVFRALINYIFHEDLILARQLHCYATWLGIYNRAKMNTATCVHMVINLDWTEEEMYLVICSLLNDLYVNIGHAIGRLRVRELNVYLIFEALPSERQLATDLCDKPMTTAEIKKHRTKIKNVLEKFDPRIKIIQRINGRICKLQSASLVYYLKSGQLTI